MVGNLHRAPRCRYLSQYFASGGLLAILLVPAAAAGTDPSLADLSSLSIEDLGKVEITSVSKRSQPLAGAPAAVFRISNEDIRRSGAATLPEALRLAPNLHVAQQDARVYAVSARGFNGVETANKLLVLVDGRSVYTPFHAGVFWDEQAMPLDDIDHVEVISGPAGTLWGANAVNGVVNVTSRHSRDTQSTLAQLRLGLDHRAATLRQGGRLSPSLTWRVYGMAYDHDDARAPAGTADGNDGWEGRQAGFRADWDGERDEVTLQGGAYHHDTDVGGEVVGRHLLARWARSLAPGSDLHVQAYYDRVRRGPTPAADDTGTVADVQLEHLLDLAGGHQIVWGAGYRHIDDRFRSAPATFTIDPSRSREWLGNAFIQDAMDLGDGLTLTVGTKVEHSSFTGTELLPSARLAARLTDRHLLWGAVSRAVRTPARIERDLVSPGVLIGGPNFVSEKLTAYEAGYRTHPAANLSLSLSLFVNDYEDLRSVAFAPGGGLPLEFANDIQGITYGGEAWADYDLRSWWRLSVGGSLIQKDLELRAGTADAAGMASIGNDPTYQVQIRSQMTWARQVELDVRMRAVDEQSRPHVPGYVEADVNVNWHLGEQLTFSLSASNLLHERHVELGDMAGELPRTLMASMRWKH